MEDTLMTHEKIEAFFAEFTFLKGIFDPKDINAVKVQRIDLELLKIIPHCSDFHDIFYDVRSSRILAFDVQGKLMFELERSCVVPNERLGWKIWEWKKPNDRILGNNLSQAIQQHIGGKDLTYVVYYRNSIVGRSSANATLANLITVYKLPKGYSMSEWLDKICADEQSKLQQELALIDGEDMVIEFFINDAGYVVRSPLSPNLCTTGRTVVQATGKLILEHGEKLFGLTVREMEKPKS